MTTSEHTLHRPIIVQNFHTADLEDISRNIFGLAVASRKLTHVRKMEWRSWPAFERAASMAFLRKRDLVLADMRDECDLRLTFDRGGNVIQVFACSKFRMVAVVIAGNDEQSVRDCLEEHRALFDIAPASQDDRAAVKVGFWYFGEKGPEREERALSVPAWAEIRDNYSAATAQSLTRMLSQFKPAAGGQLLLWHGSPGTGKTYAIRALAREWSEWCQVEYVLDPENLLGPRAEYLARVLMDDIEAGAEACSARWRLLVLEDTGELLGIDARQNAGFAVSRLLNAVDGLLGQGSRVLLLMTTNEELGRLHPALIRPGRCALQVEFHPLSAAESQKWMRARNPGIEPPSTSRTIAELYALLEGRRLSYRISIGFAVPEPGGFQAR